MSRRAIVIRCRSRLPEKTIARSAECGAIARLKMDSLSGFRAISCLKGAALNAVQIAELL